jgi:hypothetical protein
MNSILIMIKLKKEDRYEKYSDRQFFRVLDTYDYQLIDIFRDETKNKLYYYFEGPNKITNYMYLDIYHQLQKMVPDYAYIKKVEPKHTSKLH